MESISDSILTKRTKTDLIMPFESNDLVVATEAVDRLITEGGEGFYNYVDGIGLLNDPNLIVLSSRHNYFYDAEEMNNVKTIINLKELNKINCIKDALRSYSHFLPQKSNFIGYFINNNKINRYRLSDSSSFFSNRKRFDDLENGIISRFPFINRLYSVMDSKTNTYMSKSSVTALLEDYGFEVLDMTEYNGLTFFYSQRSELTFNYKKLRLFFSWND